MLTPDWNNVVVFDLETTGMSPERDAIVEIGAMRIIDRVIRADDVFHSLVNPLRSIPFYASRVHGIYHEDVQSAPCLADVLPSFLNYIGDSTLVAHNAGFDMGFLRSGARQLGLPWQESPLLCTLQLSRKTFPHFKNHKLEHLAERLGLTFEQRHRSMGDVKVTARVFLEIANLKF